MANKEEINLSALLEDISDDSLAEEVKIKRSDVNVQEELEREKEIAEARRMFEEGGFTFGEMVDDEGNVGIAIYTSSSQGTPLNVLVNLCEADLPYVDKKTREDYERYIEEFGIEYKDYDPNKKLKEIEELF